MRPYLRLLGGARIDVAPEGTPYRGRAAHRRRLALLALLSATPGHRLSRERILAYLWPEQDSTAGRKQLSESLHVIRKELGEGALVTVADDIRLDPNVVASDLVDFRRAIVGQALTEAVRLYDGPFLDGWYVSDAQPFDEWAEAERTAISAVYISALEMAAEQAEARGDRVTATAYWQRLMLARPGASAPVLRLAAVMTARGDRASAKRLLEQHCRHLANEALPVEPAVLSALEALQQPLDGAYVPVPSEARVAAEPVPQHESDQTPAHDDTPPASPAPVAARNAPPSTRRHRRRLMVALASAALGSAGGWGWWTLAAPKVQASDELPLTHIAVLYLHHDPRDDVGHIADGITGKLIDELSGVPILRVVSRTGVLHFRERPVPPPQDSLARALGVGLIVEGRVERRAGAIPGADSIRVVVSLVHASRGTIAGPPQVITRSIREASVHALRDEVAEALAAQLRRTLGTELHLLASRSGTTNPNAQQAFDRAEYQRNTAWSLVAHGRASDVSSAVRAYGTADSLLAHAIAIDPTWWEPIVLRGWVTRERARLTPTGSAGVTERIALLRRVVHHANHALTRDAAKAHALELRGAALWSIAVNQQGAGAPRQALVDSAERDLRHAMALDSMRVQAAISLAQLLRMNSRTDAERTEALRIAQQAFARDPFLAHAEGTVSQLYRASSEIGDIDGARRWCQQGRLIAPWDPTFLECTLTIARQQLRRADRDSAWAVVHALDVLDPADRAARANRGYAHIYRRMVAATVDAMHGRADSARATLAWAMRAVAHDPELRVDLRHDEALLRFALGERYEALQALREYLTHHPDYTGTVLLDPAFRQFGLDSARLARALDSLRAPE